MARQQEQADVTFVCPDCSGTGTRLEPQLYVSPKGTGASVLGPKRCNNCRGEGRIPFP